MMNSPDLSPSMSLSHFYRVWFVPIYLCQRGSRRKTYHAYEESLRHWIEYTSDPPINEIDLYTVSVFVGGLRDTITRRGTPMSPNTIAKHIRHLKTLLRHTGPPEKIGDITANLIESPPRLRKLRTIDPEPKECYTLIEIEKILEATSRFDCPATVTHQWWHSLVTIAYSTGLRIGTIMSIRPAMIKDEYLIISGRYTKTGKTSVVKLLPCMREALSLAAREEAEEIFYWPHCLRYLYTCFGRLLDAAGLPKYRHLGFHGFRRTHATEMAKINHYVGKTVLDEAIVQLPLPPSLKH